VIEAAAVRLQHRRLLATPLRRLTLSIDNRP